LTGTFLDHGLICSSLAVAAAVVFLAMERCGPRLVMPTWVGAAGAAVAAGGTIALSQSPTSPLPAVALATAPVLLSVVALRQLYAGGAVLVGAYGSLAGFAIGWSIAFVLSVPVSMTTRLLMLTICAFGLPFLPVFLIRASENLEPLCRRAQPRQRGKSTWTSLTPPRVSIHVPAHAEPPELVTATLDSLARLDYPNFEVVVVDNNTTDPALWQPVELHCQRLGERFRFIHVDQLSGAKAGALNLALAQTDPAAEFVAVVDADYQATPDFLSDIVPLFVDRMLGFVQTPHAYRCTEGSTFLRMCQWEYAIFFATEMVSIDRHGAGITVGTMCVIRRDALEQAGGWAEWCLTEDSELAVRIHSLGYTSRYLTRVYGRGLIPQTFRAYKSQRFRWTYGPVQELRHHLRLFVAKRRLRGLTVAQRVHHATHGLYGVALASSLASLPLGAGVVASMVAHHERVALPFALWLCSTVLLASGVALRWLAYRVLLGARIRDFLGGVLASTALMHVVLTANVSAVLGMPARWRRTPKFEESRALVRAFTATRAEIALAVLWAGSAAMLFGFIHTSGIVTFIGIGFALAALTFAVAPVFAVLAEHDLRVTNVPITAAARRRPWVQRVAIPLAFASVLIAVVGVAVTVHGALGQAGTPIAGVTPMLSGSNLLPAMGTNPQVFPGRSPGENGKSEVGQAAAHRPTTGEVVASEAAMTVSIGQDKPGWPPSSHRPASAAVVGWVGMGRGASGRSSRTLRSG
jgi:cellulose synthase/poly-beta-1,6-N-acetylglucosamine synthase-like glycosyltransferase